MSGSDRSGAHKAQATHFGSVGAAMGSGQWPMSVHYAGDVGMPVGSAAAYEYSFGRTEEYASPLMARANAAKALLLIDSVRLTRECLSHLLMSHLVDYEIISVAHAQQAGECGAFRPDVVLLNAGSARLTDSSLLDDITTIFAATRRAPTLLLSEHGEASEESQAAEFGLVGLFPSTFGVSLLVAAIQLVVAGGQFHIPVTSTRHLHSRLEGNGARR
jgi:response regulator RpfG family c-di-GMP phosphodiesterase